MSTKPLYNITIRSDARSVFDFGQYYRIPARKHECWDSRKLARLLQRQKHWNPESFANR